MDQGEHQTHLLSHHENNRKRISITMKFLVAVIALAAVASAQQAQQPIAILRQAQDVAPDGAYSYNYETENGISHSESGSPTAINEEGQASVVAQGQFRYTAPDGTPIELSYVADENGFQPQGAHLPVAPPAPEIPFAIQRALDWIAAHPPKPETNQRRF